MCHMWCDVWLSMAVLQPRDASLRQLMGKNDLRSFHDIIEPLNEKILKQSYFKASFGDVSVSLCHYYAA